MPALEIEILQQIRNNDINNKYNIFLETGTYNGETILKMEVC